VSAVAEGSARGDSGSWREASGSGHAAADVTIVANDIRAVGGMERVLTELIVGLRELGHRVTVIARTCELPAGVEVTVRRVRGPGRPFVLAYPWFLLAGSLALRRWRRGVVHATGAIVLNRVDVVAVHYCHQVGPVNPSRASWPHRAQMRLAGFLKRRTERVCFRRNRGATFVCVSDGVAAEVREHYPELAGRVITIHNGVDMRAFAPGRRAQEARALRAALQLGERQPVAAFVGSEWERKGLRPLIDALAQAPGWALLVAGGGDRRAYEALAEERGVAASLRWLGVTRDVALAYAVADAFVLPSAYETFGLVAFEAAASGVPLLATPVSGVRELLRDGENGFQITREPQDIAARLRTLGADAELRRRMGAAARAAVERFGWEQTVARHHELYARLASAKRT
jgi:UDP-glucose:(heptosyl)LPS alpha-1,3-glucosyltransferase